MATKTKRPKPNLDTAAQGVTDAIFGKKATVKPSQAKEFADELARRKEANGNGHASGLSTVTPSGILAHDPSAGAAPPVGEVELPVDLIERHPDNRHPLPESIAKRAASIAKHGQLEAVVVRRLASGRYQLLSGETRWLAKRDILRHKTIRARIREATDAEALQMLAEYNANRDDLNPIEKARMIKRLCEPIDEGGSGLTREEAAKIYGLESHSAASNLVRLLELPKWWQDKVASGQLSQRHARELLPFANRPNVLKALEKEAKEPGTLANWRREVWNAVREVARPMKGYFSFPDGKRQWRHGEVLIKPTDEEREQLDIVEVMSPGEERLAFAFNVKLWDELQHAAEAKRREREAKREERQKAKGGATTKAKQPSAQEAAEAAAKREEQFARRLYDWKINWLRYLVAKDLHDLSDDNEPLVQAALLRLLLWATVDRGRGPDNDSQVYLNLRFDEREEVLEQALGKYGDVWRALHKAAADELWPIALRYGAALLWSDSEGPERFVPPQVVEGLARLLQTDLADFWRRELAGPLTVEYFDLHTKEQLVALADELGVTLPAGSKGQLVEALAGDAMTKTKLPAEIKAAKPSKRGVSQETEEE